MLSSRNRSKNSVRLRTAESRKIFGWPVDYPVSSADHVATMYKLVGVDPRMPIYDRAGREHRAALDGDPISGVIA